MKPTKLALLEPEWLRYESRIETYQTHKDDGYLNDQAHRHTEACWESITGPRVYFPFAATIAEAQGIRFLCPICFEKNGGAAGTHQVICWSRSKGVPDAAQPGPGRWKLDGTGFDDLTLNGDAPGGGGARSVQLTGGGCAAHFHITDGMVTD